MIDESRMYDRYAADLMADHRVEMLIRVEYPVPASAVPAGHSAAAAEQLSYDAGDFTALEALETAARNPNHFVTVEFNNIY